MEGITRRSLVAGSLAALGSLALPFTALADEAPAQEGQTDVQLDAVATKNDVNVSYQSSWKFQDDGGSYMMFTSPDGNLAVTVTVSDNSEANTGELESTKSFFVILLLVKASAYTEFNPQILSYKVGADESVCRAFYSGSVGDTSCYGLVDIAWRGNQVVTFETMSVDVYGLSDNRDVYEAMWEGRSYGQAQPSEQPAEGQPAEQPQMTMGQQNALQRAHDYLEYTAFSYSGLIGQLEYEGFSTEDATFAADNCGADWNAQAAAKAQDYLEYSAFSRQGLIDQLVYEGFTAEQAEYGVAAVGY